HDDISLGRQGMPIALAIPSHSLPPGNTEAGSSASHGVDSSSTVALVAPSGRRIESTISWISAGGGGVSRDTTRQTAKFSTMPTAPMPSAEIPKSHGSISNLLMLMM